MKDMQFQLIAETSKQQYWLVHDNRIPKLSSGYQLVDETTQSL